MYIAIKELNVQNYPISILCDFAGIARSSYYKWLNIIETAVNKENLTIIEKIIKIYDSIGGIYGYRRITMNINRNLNKQYNHKRIYRLMKFIKLQSMIRKKRKKYAKVTHQITAENILNRDFSAATLNEK